MSLDSPNFQRTLGNERVDMRVKPPFQPDLFDKIHGAYRTQISNHLLRMTRGIPGFDYKYQDFTQETFLKAYMALPKVEEQLIVSGEELNVRPWLFSIATHLCIDQLRRAGLRSIDSYEVLAQTSRIEPTSLDDPVRAVVDQERTRKVRAVLEELPPRYRIALEMHHLEERPWEEIVEAIGRETSRKAINSLLYRARIEFRENYLRLEGSAEI